MILVTGGAKGLGRAVVLELAKRGHDLLLHYRSSQKEAEQVAKECQSLGVKVALFQGDFSCPETTEDFVARLLLSNCRIKGIVNNVGVYAPILLEETPLVKWRSLFESNLHAPFALIMALLPTLKKEKGRIVNIGGVGAQKTAPAYATTKEALRFFTQLLSKELASDGITVNMVSPGQMENSVDLPKKLPMGRPATLIEVAQIVATFFDDAYSYVTGQNLEVAGALPS